MIQTTDARTVTTGSMFSDLCDDCTQLRSQLESMRGERDVHSHAYKREAARHNITKTCYEKQNADLGREVDALRLRTAELEKKVKAYEEEKVKAQEEERMQREQEERMQREQEEEKERLKRRREEGMQRKQEEERIQKKKEERMQRREEEERMQRKKEEDFYFFLFFLIFFYSLLSCSQF